MATELHPLTGVELNIITLSRKALNEEEAVTVHVLSKQYEDQDTIAHRLGTNQARVSEILKGHSHEDTAEIAAQILRDNGDTFI